MKLKVGQGLYGVANGVTCHIFGNWERPQDRQFAEGGFVEKPLADPVSLISSVSSAEILPTSTVPTKITNAIFTNTTSSDLTLGLYIDTTNQAVDGKAIVKGFRIPAYGILTYNEIQGWEVIDPGSSVNTSPSTQYVHATLSTAQLKALHATPIVLVAPPGPGKVIVPDSVLASYTYGSAVFNNSLRAQVIIDTATAEYGSVLLTGGASFIDKMLLGALDDGANRAVANKALTAGWSGTDSTTGDGSLDLYITYKIITL